MLIANIINIDIDIYWLERITLHFRIIFIFTNIFHMWHYLWSLSPPVSFLSILLWGFIYRKVNQISFLYSASVLSRFFEFYLCIPVWSSWFPYQSWFQFHPNKASNIQDPYNLHTLSIRSCPISQLCYGQVHKPFLDHRLHH